MCRTANGADCNFEESYAKNIRSVIDNGTLYDDMVYAGQKDGRGNICPTSIILPVLAMQCRDKVYKSWIKTGAIDSKIKDSVPEADLKSIVYEDEEFIEDVVIEFMKLLDKKIHEAKDSLMDRYDWITSQPAASAKFMYENGTMYGYKKEEGIKSALKHGTLAIGQLGLAETLQILIGQDHGVKVPEPMKKDIVDKMVSKIEEKENRKLSIDEIKEIESYVNDKK